MLPGCSCCRAASTCTPISTGFRAGAHRGHLLYRLAGRGLRRHHHDRGFCGQVKGTSPLAGLADWHERASVAAVDMGAHMIMTEVNDQYLADMKSLIHDEGVTTFKLFTAYPDVLMIDDGQIFRTMRLVGANGGMVQVHAENGHVIDVLVQEALAGRQHQPQVAHADAADHHGGRGDPPRHPHRRSWPRRRSTSCTSRRRGARRGDRGARPRASGPRRDLPALPPSSPTRRYDRAGSRPRSS